MKVSVIIPFYNEEKSLSECLDSLLTQTYRNLEIILVDDGSVDQSRKIASNYPVEILKQNHQGPGMARNLGAQKATGEILVFVDADMVFDKKFIEKLIEPILTKKAIGTFSKEEYVLNKDNIWSKCWNINKELPYDRMHPLNYPNRQPVFRAILKKEFKKTCGFKPIGYIDDHTLADQLQQEAVMAPGAIFYHRNPDNLIEVWRQARWIGKSEFKRRKIKNENLMKLIALLRYSIPLSLISGTLKAIKFRLPFFLFFKILYDLAIEVSLIGSFFGEQKYK